MEVQLPEELDLPDPTSRCQSTVCFHVSPADGDKNGSIWEVKEILLVKGKEPDVEAKTLHVQSAQIPPRSGLPVTGTAVPTPGPV